MQTFQKGHVQLRGACQVCHETQEESETVTTFLIALRAIDGNCAFGVSLNERLRDQLAIGINNDAWQQDLFRLYPTAEATLQQVSLEASALILEQASTQQQQIRSMAKVDQAAETQGVHRMKETRPSLSKCQVPHNKKELDGTMDCIRCGRSRHTVWDTKKVTFRIVSTPYVRLYSFELRWYTRS